MTTETRLQASGWVIFASVMLFLSALSDIAFGINLIADAQWVAIDGDGAQFFGTSTWGWIEIGLGMVLALAAMAVVSGRRWGRVIGIISAGIGLVDAILTLGINPAWNIISIALNALVIYALTIHGDEVREIPVDAP